MNKFSIKAVERLSGIKAQTIRVWEQRYGLLQPDRKQSRHRVYSNDDLKSLLKVVYLYNNGHKISNLASLDNSQIDDLVRNNKTHSKEEDFSIVLLIEAVLDINEDSFRQITYELEQKYNFEFIMLHCLFPLLQRIGILWITDRVLPGQEHFASNMVIRKIIEATDRIQESQLQRQGKVLMFTPKDDFHEVSLLFMRYLLKKNGYQTVYLGCNITLETVKAFFHKHNPTHIYVSFIANLQEEPPIEYLKKMREMFPRVYLVANAPSLKDSDFTMQGLRVVNKEKDLLDFAYNIFNHTD